MNSEITTDKNRTDIIKWGKWYLPLVGLAIDLDRNPESWHEGCRRDRVRSVPFYQFRFCSPNSYAFEFESTSGFWLGELLRDPKTFLVSPAFYQLDGVSFRMFLWRSCLFFFWQLLLFSFKMFDLIPASLFSCANFSFGSCIRWLCGEICCVIGFLDRFSYCFGTLTAYIGFLKSLLNYRTVQMRIAREGWGKKVVWI